jgi:hypothetical protein
MSYRNSSILAGLLLFVLAGSSPAKPKLKVAADGFPAGPTTPEGAATDLTRAFMQRDAAMFRKVCIRPYGEGQGRAEYTSYLDGVSDHLRRATEKPSPDDPKKIVSVFAARHLSKNGPASYGYAAFDFRDVMFVDVEVMLQNGNRHLQRTMVIKDRDDKWYVHPMPDVSPLLSYGLYEESASLQAFTDVYEVER